MTRIDPNRIQALISQSFDSARAPGQLGGRSVQMVQAQAPRVQPSASGFINKVKSLYDRGVREQRAEEGITRGVKNFDKALSKLLDAMNPAKGNINLDKIQRHLEALPSSAHSATSRGADHNELIEARLKLYIGKLGNDQLYELSMVNRSSLFHLTQKSERLESSLLSSDREQKIVNFGKKQLENLGTVFSKELDEREKFKDAGFSADQMVSFRQSGGKSEDIAEFKKEGFTNSEIKLYAGFAVAEAKSLKSEYQRLNIPVNEKTIVKDFKASHIKEDMEVLGSGNVNKAYKGVYKMSDGSSFTGVFKAEKKEFPLGKIPFSIFGCGIPDAIAGGRNMASHALNDLLGFDVVTRAEFGMNGDKKLGIVMEMAHGQPGNQAKQEMFDDPVVRRELTKLQWLDGLTAQVDRHPGNYFIETYADGGGKRVVGIDNDMSFGKRITDPNNISKNHNGYFNGLKLPPIIDTEMAKAFRELTPEKLQASLSGLLDDDEIKSAKQRLEGIKEHIDKLEKADCIIYPYQWSNPGVGDLLMKETNPKNASSYVARDKALVTPKN